MTPSRRLTALVSVALVASLSIALPHVAAGQSTTTQGGDSAAATPGAAFPLPVVAPVLTETEGPAPLAVTSFGVADADLVEIRFAAPFELPDAFRYRVDLRIGQPGETGATQSRVSFLVEEGGAPEGLVEVGNGSGWDTEGTTEVAFDDGLLTLALPTDFEVDDEDLAWLDINLVEEEGDAAARFLTPLVPAGQALAPTGPTISAADYAWGSVDQQPPAPPLELGASPVLFLEGDELVVEYQESIPSLAEGRSVVKVVDVVRIAPDFEGGGAAPYLLVIDHELGSVSLLDGTYPMPAEVPNDGSWLVTGLPERAIGALDQIRVSLPEVLEVFGLDTADLASDDQLALGLARSAQVRTGVQDSFPIRSDGVVATTAWLTAAASVEPQTTASSVAEAVAPEVAAPPTSGGDGGNDGIVVFVAIGCLVALLGTAGFLVVRWLEHRRRVMASGPVVPTGPAPPPSESEQEELAEFTRQLFDNRR